MKSRSPMSRTTQIAVFGGGCFWCTEAIFASLRGVISVMPGYAGGETPNPTYEQVCSGTTGHAEVIKIDFDPQQISFGELLEIFFALHDPTTRNRQGADVGEQYRSVILYSDEEQQRVAQAYLEELASAKAFDRPIVTQVVPLTKFYTAEDYHRNYYAANQDAPYCQVVISPKLAKLREKFSRQLKSG